MKKSKETPITSVKIGKQLKYLCQGNNRQRKVYPIDKRDFADLIHDMYEGEYKVFDYPADSSAADKAYSRTKTQKTIANHIDDKQGVSFNWINIYCKFFGCTSDFLLGIIDMPTHETTNIYLKTGLSYQAINGLLALKEADNISIENGNTNYQLAPILDSILALNNGLSFEMLMRDIREYLISDYLIPATHDKKGNPIFSESEYDCSDMPLIKSKQYYQTLYRSKEDLSDYVINPITKERREAEAIFTLSKHLASIKNDLENNK